MHYVSFGNQKKKFADISSHVRSIEELPRNVLSICFCDGADAVHWLKQIDILIKAGDCFLIYGPEGRQEDRIRMAFKLTEIEASFTVGDEQAYIRFSISRYNTFVNTPQSQSSSWDAQAGQD